MNGIYVHESAYHWLTDVMEDTIVLSMRREGVKTKRFEFQLLAA